MQQNKKSIFLDIDNTIREEQLYADYALTRQD